MHTEVASSAIGTLVQPIFNFLDPSSDGKQTSPIPKKGCTFSIAFYGILVLFFFGYIVTWLLPASNLDTTYQQATMTAQSQFASMVTMVARQEATRESLINELQLTVSYLENDCKSQNSYSFEVGRIIFNPRLGSTITIGEEGIIEDIQVRWQITNEGCPARNIRLVTDDGVERIPIFIDSIGDAQGNSLFEGEDSQMVVTLASIEDANTVDEQLFFVVEDPAGNNLRLDNIAPLELKVPEGETWIIMNTPSPPTDTPTPITIPTTPTPIIASTNASVATNTPNFSATQTRIREQEIISAQATKRVFDATATSIAIATLQSTDTPTPEP